MTTALIAGTLFASVLFAEEQSNLFESPRSQGRGRTNVAAYDSDEASRFNPATLGESKITFQLRPLQFDLLVGENSVAFISDLLAVTSSTSDNAFVDFMRKLEFGKRLYGRGQMGLLAMRFGGFELSPFFVGEATFDIHDPALPGAVWKIDSVAGMGMSYGWELSKDLAVGVTVRPLHRWYSSNDIGMVDMLDYVGDTGKDSSQIFRLVSGWGVGIDTGLVWKPDATTRFGLTILNLGDTEYFQDKGTQPPPIQQKINAGMLKRVALGKWHWDTSIDGQGLWNRGGVNITRLFHGGMELGRQLFSRDNDFGVLGGVNEGYLTYGLFADLWLFRLDIVNYAVELGQYPGQIRDRRWGATLRTSMTF